MVRCAAVQRPVAPCSGRAAGRHDKKWRHRRRAWGTFWMAGEHFGWLGNISHCPPQTILGKQGALQKFLGKILGMNFCSSNALLKLLNIALFPQWNLFCDFFMWFFLRFCKSVLLKMLPQNIQFLKILKSLVF